MIDYKNYSVYLPKGAESIPLIVQGERRQDVVFALPHLPGPETFAYVIVDGSIDTPWTRHLAPSDKPDDNFCKPSAIAETIYHVAHQERSAWTFHVDLRPFGEVW